MDHHKNGKKKVVSHFAKLKPHQVRQIRRLREKGMGVSVLAERFHSSQTAISLLLSGKTYKRVL